MRSRRRRRVLAWDMATLSERLPENVPGRYYVDASCIDCDQCRAIAPEIFARNEANGLSVVAKQPLTAEELALADEALNACATASIGNDGT